MITSLKSYLQLFHNGDRCKVVESLDVSERTVRRWVNNTTRVKVENGEIVEYKRVVKGKLKPLKITIISNVAKRRRKFEKELPDFPHRIVTLKSKPDLVLIDKPRFHVFDESEILNLSKRYNTIDIEKFFLNCSLLFEDKPSEKGKLSNKL